MSQGIRRDARFRATMSQPRLTGVSRYLGRSVKMEAHKRNLAAHAEAGDGAGPELLGAFSVASIYLSWYRCSSLRADMVCGAESVRGTAAGHELRCRRSVLFWGSHWRLEP